ncbi:MAG: hypothetical protein C4334_00200 [Pyrinomonas sp.]|uniref:hypothetical protein n=1 Tax=Pyrinomonas sp. TaxID=2080306 RepID=UPI00332692B6
MKVNEAHRLHIGVTLRHLERDLIAFQETIGKEASPARLTVHLDRIRPAAEIFELVALLRREIESIADELDLSPCAESTVRAFLGRLHLKVASIGELLSLRAVGDPDPELARYVETKVDRLEALLRRLIALLEEQLRENHA